VSKHRHVFARMLPVCMSLLGRLAKRQHYSGEQESMQVAALQRMLEDYRVGDPKGGARRCGGWRT